MGNCCKKQNKVAYIQSERNLVKIFSKNNTIHYEGEINSNGNYHGYGKLYDNKNNRIFDGTFENNVFVSGYIKYFEPYLKLKKIEYYNNGIFIRELY